MNLLLVERDGGERQGQGQRQRGRDRDREIANAHDSNPLMRKQAGDIGTTQTLCRCCSSSSYFACYLVCWWSLRQPTNHKHEDMMPMAKSLLKWCGYLVFSPNRISHQPRTSSAKCRWISRVLRPKRSSPELNLIEVDTIACCQ